MPMSNNRMPRIERMGGAAALARAASAHSQEEERRLGEEHCCGEYGAGAARSASSARLMPQGDRAAPNGRIAGKTAKKLLPRRFRAKCDVAEKQPFGRADEARCQQARSRPDSSNCRVGCRSRCDSSRAERRCWAKWSAQSAPANPPHRTAKSTCAPPTTVFTIGPIRFSKKSFGSSTIAEYNLVVGWSGASQAMRLREITRVSQPITTATGN